MRTAGGGVAIVENQRIGIIIPAYDAERTLPGVLRRLPDELPIESIWIVDDGSRDATARVAAAAAARDPRVEPLGLPQNSGYGAAVQRGLQAARRAGVEIAVCLHADGQYAPERLPALIEALRRRRLDLLQGSRIAGGGALGGGMPLYKYLANRALTTLENRVYRLQLSDYHSGYLIYGARALQQLPFDRLSTSFDFDLEVIASARSLGLRIGEEPIPTHYGGEVSHLQPIPYGLRALRVMFRYLRGRYRALATTRAAAMLLSLLVIATACAPRFPWSHPGAGGQPITPVAATVKTLNRGYDRTRSRALVRRIRRPTRAALDYAAYHANVLLESQRDPIAPLREAPDPGSLFGEALVSGSVVTSLAQSPLTPPERARPLAFAPLVDYLAQWKSDEAAGLERARAELSEESWGKRRRPGVYFQRPTTLWIHRPRDGQPQLWVEIEFCRWARLFERMPDGDGDGYAEIYARLRPGVIGRAALRRIREDYAARVLSRSEVTRWANELASTWYPSYFTDVLQLPPGSSWPRADTEAPVREELAQLSVEPTVIVRGKPQGQVIYNVFVVDGLAAAASRPSSRPSRAALIAALRKSPVSARPKQVAAALQGELQKNGGSYETWLARVRPLRRALRRALRRRPAKLQALIGLDGFLFYRKSLTYILGGDLQKQPAGKNPLPAIVGFKRYLSRLGVDFLLVPVPAKAEVFVDKLDRGGKSLGTELPVVNPHGRKFLAELAEAGVEIIDLLPAYLAGRRATKKNQPPLYQPQDTHWTDRGLQLAADRIARRIARYSWYARLEQDAVEYRSKRVTFKRFGDLHSRLAAREKPRYEPQMLVGHQVIAPDGTPYEDDPHSPIVVLGDSFTGVFERTYCQHAGISAHIARRIRYPVDLVMSYGGGPNVRGKLLSRGEADLKRKRLVIWIFAARDLYDYWEDWKPLDHAAADHDGNDRH